MANNIPKVIHYCWFGRNPLPETAKKCIESWRKFLPDYEIKEWNEDNFDISLCHYASEAYSVKKYAFVSDYARFWILYRHGVLYFDTDVELIRPIDDIIERGAFMGCERSADSVSLAEKMGVAPGLGLGINPGLGLGINPGLGLYKEILDFYEHTHFLNDDGVPNTTDTVVTITSRFMCSHGLKLTSEVQQCAGIWVYPNDYFAPKDVDTKKLTITENTRSIHHYDASWAEWYDRAAGERAYRLQKFFGKKLGDVINEVIYTYQRDGIVTTVKKIIGNIF